MEMGQVHLARFSKERAYYDTVMRKRVGGLEGFSNGEFLWDPANATTKPWTFKDTDHYFKPSNDAIVSNRDFKTFDSPTNFITDVITTGGDTVDRSELTMEHKVFFAVRTTVPNVNGSADVLTQRLVLNWQVLANGTWDQASGAWTYTGVGDGVDGDTRWTEVVDGSHIPVPAESRILNELLNTVDLPWVESPQ